MMELLKQAISLGVLRPLDVHVANILANKDEPDILLVVACLSAETGIGNVCLMLDQLRIDQLFSGRHPKLAQALWLASGKPDIAEWHRRLIMSSAVGDGNSARPLVLRGQRLYLQRMWRYEGDVALFIKKNIKYQVGDETKLREILNRLFDAETDILNWQKIAVTVALTRKISVIFGESGTGKTTIIAKLLVALIQIDKRPRLRIQLAAPTGKAVARLNEVFISTIRNLSLKSEERSLLPTQAITLHRLLGVQSHTQFVRYNRDNQLHLDVLVVDEASSVDLPMMARLISALPEGIRVIFLVDSNNQLPSVQSGSVLSDICRFSELEYSELRAIELSRLTGCLLSGQKEDSRTTIRDSLCFLSQNYRFNIQSGMKQLANAVNVGDFIKVQTILHGDFNDIKSYSLSTAKEYKALIELCVLEYSNYLKQVTSGISIINVLKLFNKFQVLCALRVGPFGVVELNQQIESRLQDSGLIFRLSEPWYLGRPVIITRNENTLGLCNGDIGIVLQDQYGKLRVYFLLPGGRIRSLNFNQLPEHEIAYAITVHQSQGSEFDQVVLVLHNDSSLLLSRELIYTAIFRARARFLLYATDEVLIQVISTQARRQSGLYVRLFDEL